MIRLTFAVFLFLASPTFAEQAIVCPPDLDYCIRKPVKDRMSVDDYIARFRAEQREYQARRDVEFDAIDRKFNFLTNDGLR